MSATNSRVEELLQRLESSTFTRRQSFTRTIATKLEHADGAKDWDALSAEAQLVLGNIARTRTAQARRAVTRAIRAVPSLSVVVDQLLEQGFVKVENRGAVAGGVYLDKRGSAAWRAAYGNHRRMFQAPVVCSHCHVHPCNCELLP